MYNKLLDLSSSEEFLNYFWYHGTSNQLNISFFFGGGQIVNQIIQVKQLVISNYDISSHRIMWKGPVKAHRPNGFWLKGKKKKKEEEEKKHESSLNKDNSSAISYFILTKEFVTMLAWPEVLKCHVSCADGKISIN